MAYIGHWNEKEAIFNVKYEIVLRTPYSKARWGWASLIWSRRMYPISNIPPTHQVTEDFEVAYARAVRHYKRNLRLRRIQIALRISLGLVLLGVLGIAACLFATLTSTSSSPPTPRPTTQKTSTSPIITKTSNQPTTTTAITEPSPTSKRSTTIQTTAITTSTSTRSSSSTSTSTAYRPIPSYSGKTKL